MRNNPISRAFCRKFAKSRPCNESEEEVPANQDQVEHEGLSIEAAPAFGDNWVAPPLEAATVDRPSPPENGHFSSSLKLGPSKRINAYGSNDESLKVWFDYFNCFLPYDVLVVGRKFLRHGWLSHVL